MRALAEVMHRRRSDLFSPLMNQIVRVYVRVPVEEEHKFAPIRHRPKVELTRTTTEVKDIRDDAESCLLFLHTKFSSGRRMWKEIYLG